MFIFFSQMSYTPTEVTKALASGVSLASNLPVIVRSVFEMFIQPYLPCTIDPFGPNAFSSPIWIRSGPRQCPRKGAICQINMLCRICVSQDPANCKESAVLTGETYILHPGRGLRVGHLNSDGSASRWSPLTSLLQLLARVKECYISHQQGAVPDASAQHNLCPSVVLLRGLFAGVWPSPMVCS